MSADDRLLPIIQPGQRHATMGRPPLFERIGIVGLGLIGGSIALAAREIWPAGLVIGVDAKEVLEQAMARHAVDVAASDLTIVSEADLVILAAPVRTNVTLLQQLPDYIDKPVIVTDVGSTKREIVDAAASLPAHVTFVGGHPLGGSTRSGLEAARADLFAGRPWLFTPRSVTRGGESGPEVGDSGPEPDGETAADETSGREGEATRRLFEFARALGAAPHAIDAARHDRLLAFISHLPQLAASALMQVVGDGVGEQGLSLSGRGLQDTTRLAGSPAGIWADICASNADEIRAALDALIAALGDLRAHVDDRETIERVFGAANRWRAALTGKP